jgi:hypothetical protein
MAGCFDKGPRMTRKSAIPGCVNGSDEAAGSFGGALESSERPRWLQWKRVHERSRKWIIAVT